MDSLFATAINQEKDIAISIHECEINGTKSYVLHIVVKGNVVFEGFYTKLDSAKAEFIEAQETYFGKVIKRNILS